MAGTGATFEVTGTTALNIDVAEMVRGALIPYLVVVVGLAILLLLVVFRSVVIPLKAAFGFLLSVLAALGCIVAVFQWSWGASLFGVETTGPIMSLTPIFLVGIVFGLAMDYEVFLVSRIREAYVQGHGSGPAITTGFRYSARIVVAASLIMVSVFAGFITADESMVKMIGFGLAVAVLFDAIVVRLAFCPPSSPCSATWSRGSRAGWTGSCPTSMWRVSHSACTRPTLPRTTRSPIPGHTPPLDLVPDDRDGSVPGRTGTVPSTPQAAAVPSPGRVLSFMSVGCPHWWIHADSEGTHGSPCPHAVIEHDRRPHDARPHPRVRRGRARACT